MKARSIEGGKEHIEQNSRLEEEVEIEPTYFGL
jgi:hypothetical protein